MKIALSALLSLLSVITFTSAIANTGEIPSSYLNDLARFLAGMPVDPASPFEKLTKTSHYKEHRKKMDEFWEKVETGNIRKIISWRERYIVPHFNHGTVFYPLCGGDFINMYTFFPTARRYIMVSMEPEGKIPDPLKLSENQLKQRLNSLRGCIWTISSVNYFVTKAMRASLKSKELGGTLPVYLIFAARLNLNLKSIQPIGISPAGVLASLDENGKIHGETPAVKGSRITFTAPGTPTPREIIYLSLRITPRSMEAATPEGRYFSSLSGLNVLIKSAIYLLHSENYRAFCRSLLERTDLLVEDDSGIPYRYFTRDKFDIFLFGTFDMPVRLREIPSPPRQPDLAQAFKERAGELPFHFGYGVLRKDHASNLLLAVRKRGI